MSIFTKRHYLFLSRALRRAVDHTPLATDRQVIREAIETLAIHLSLESPGFDRDLFLHNIFEPHNTSTSTSPSTQEHEKCPTP